MFDSIDLQTTGSTPQRVYYLMLLFINKNTGMQRIKRIVFCSYKQEFRTKDLP
jgi:hypothetical protein